MSAPRPDEPGSSGLSFLREEPARLLWQHWQQGQRPDVEQFLSQFGQLPVIQLVAILRVDQWQRWLSGDRVPVETYFERFPMLQSGDAAIEMMYGECLVREELGETPTLEEYLQRFPQHAGSLLPSKNNTLQSVPAAPPVGPTSKSSIPPIPVIPGYEILESLGGGGMGLVYKARAASEGRIVALKVIRPDLLAEPNALRRFQREVEATVRLAHPNIVAIHAANELGDCHYIIMEYIPGVDLQKLVASTGALPIARACDFIRQAALGLQHAHECGLVHRDIKPANLMVSRPPAPVGKPADPGGVAPRSDVATALLLAPGAIVKLLDLGLARVLQAEDGQASLTTLTHAGTFMGTPDYMAPEQWEDAHQADIRADLYSLGCTFYYLLTGQVPFPGGSIIQKLDKHRSMTPVAVERLRADLPRPTAAIVRKLMAKRPSERFQTPAELAETLAPHLHSSSSLPSTGIKATPRSASGLPVGEVRRFSQFAGPLNCLAIAPDGVHAAAADDRIIRIWEVESGKEVWTLKGHTDTVRALAYAPDGRSLISGASDRNVRVWNVKIGQPLRSLPGHIDAVKCVAVAPEGAVIASGSSDRHVRLWDATTGRKLLKLEGHGGDICAVLFTPDSRAVLSSSWDKTIRLWDLKTGKQLRSFGGTYSSLQWAVTLGLAISPDSRRFLMGCSDSLLRLWDIEDGRELLQRSGHTDAVTAVAFSPTGRHWLSASRDRTVRFWDAATGQELHRFEGHTDHVTHVLFTPDGRHALSAGADQTVRLWRLPPV